MNKNTALPWKGNAKLNVSKKGVTTEVKIFYELLHGGYSDKVDLISKNSEQARKKQIQFLVTSNTFGLKSRVNRAFLEKNVGKSWDTKKVGKVGLA